MRVLLAAFLLMASGALQSAAALPELDAFAQKYPALTGLFHKAMLSEIEKLGIADSEAVADCVTVSTLKGVPDDDLSVMEASVEQHQPTAEVRAAFIRWMGPAVVHGGPTGSTYQDGTPRDMAAEQEVNQRVQDNARALCPTFLNEYPIAFQY